MKNILYIGNNLSQKSKYHSTMASLSTMLTNEGFNVKCISDKKNKFFRLLDMCLAVLKYRKTTHWVLIDTFSTSNFYYALIISQMARLFSIPYIPILHGGNLPNRLAKNPFLSKLIFKNASINVSPSIYLLEEFEKRNFEVTHIPNIIAIRDYSFKPRKTIRPNLLWVRALDNTYNPQMAIKVLALLKRDIPTCTLCMVGPDKSNLLPELKKLASDLNVSESITFTGVLPKEEWHELSENYDLFINTTTVDNIPVSIIEAMALGIPIISTNVGGIPYLISHGKDGILVPSNHVEAMVLEIKKLLDNHLFASKIAQKAREKVNTYDSSFTKAKWLKLLTK